MPRVFAGIVQKRLPRWALVCGACVSVYLGLLWAHDYPAANLVWVWVLLPVCLWSLSRHNLLTLALLCACCFGAGLWRGAAVMNALLPYRDLQRHTVTLRVRATDDAVYGERSQLSFTADRLQVLAPAALDLPGSMKISGFGEAAIYRGDIVQVTGRPYLTRGNTQASLSFAQLHVLAHGGSGIDAFRQRFVAGMQSALPEPQASFGLGLLIGQRSTLPPKAAHALLAAGLTHIIAVSGYNLTIMVEAARRTSAKRSKFQTMAACLLLIAIFLLITGSSPSIVRAAMVSVLSLFAWYYGRVIKPLVLLCVAAAASAFANPLYVWGNVSWYLSFLAFYGVLVLAPLVTRRMYGTGRPRLLTQICIESMCAEAMTLPYILHIFGQISLVALPANVLVVAAVPLAMLLTAVAGLAGMLVPSLAGWVAWPAKLLLRLMLAAAQLMANVPHAFVEGVGFSASMLTLSYALIVLVTLVLWNKARQNAIITEKQEEHEP
jgi:competence protein ComEC